MERASTGEGFGPHLKALRLDRGLTQKALGGERFSHAYISSLESGRRTPSAAAVLFLAERLGSELIDTLLLYENADLRGVMKDLPTEGDAALRLLKLVLERVQSSGEPSLKADVFRIVGEFHIASRPELAENFLMEAAHMYREGDGSNTRWHLGRCLYLMGTIAEHREHQAAAMGHFREAAALFS